MRQRSRQIIGGKQLAEEQHDKYKSTSLIIKSDADQIKNFQVTTIKGIEGVNSKKTWEGIHGKFWREEREGKMIYQSFIREKLYT